MANALNEDQTVLYTSGRSRLLWFVVVLTVGFLFLVCWLASLLTPEEMIRSFGSVNAGRFFQAGLILIGSFFIWPMLWLSGRYIVRVEKVNGDDIAIQTWTVLGAKTKTWAATAWANSNGRFHDGHLDYRGVNAPWISVRPAGGKKMIVDIQGDFPYGVEALTEILAPSGIN